MRTANSKKNLVAGLSLTLVMTLLGFITRKIFVDNIGTEYLGLNGLLTNILSMVSLLEGGVGASVVYNLYKPLAENDQPRIIALIQFYRKIYRYIAVGVVGVSLCIYPFLDIFIKDGESLQYVSVVFFIFLFNSTIPYFTAYKWSLINTDQKHYKLIGINFVYQIGLNLSKLAILYYTKNYILYLIVESLFLLSLNIAVVQKINRLYPYIVTKVKYKIDTNTRKTITTNSKALFLHSLGGYLAHSTDNILISSFVGISTVGLYSNYTLITGYVNSYVNQTLNSISESIGNLIATETPKYIYKVFRTIFLLNFIVVSIPGIILANITHPFISWWLGEEYLLKPITMIVILLNFYIFGMRTSSYIFKVKSGIFTQDKFSPLIQGIINLVLSLILVRYWGITGVLLGTTISVLAIGFWQFPKLVYKYTFKQPLKFYFSKYLNYTLLAVGSWAISWCLCNLFTTNSLIIILCKGAISVSIPAAMYYLFLRNTEEMKNLLFTYIKPALIKAFK